MIGHRFVAFNRYDELRMLQSVCGRGAKGVTADVIKKNLVCVCVVCMFVQCVYIQKCAFLRKDNRSCISSPVERVFRREGPCACSY